METREILEHAHKRLTDASERTEVGPAGDWFLDNFHVVQENIREVRAGLPASYYRELPELDAGPLAGYPRAYELAITLVSHTEGRIDGDALEQFVRAFQQVSPIRIGELWAIPAMLRLGLIENVRRMALRTVQRLDEVEAADRWAARIVASGARGGDELPGALGEFLTSHPRLTPVFVSRFLRQLRLADQVVTSLAWLEPWM